jgi:nucleotide-binding universal stress UspA family protein
VKIVLGYVPTDEGEAALRRAIEEARLRNAQLVVVHSRKTATTREMDEIAKEREQIDKLEARLADAGVPFEVHDYVRGKTPSEELVSVANELGAELIVIGLRRRTMTGKFLLGSNASEILLGADCAVLAVKADPIAH